MSVKEVLIKALSEEMNDFLLIPVGTIGELIAKYYDAFKEGISVCGDDITPEAFWHIMRAHLAEEFAVKYTKDESEEIKLVTKLHMLRDNNIIEILLLTDKETIKAKINEILS